MVTMQLFVIALFIVQCLAAANSSEVIVPKKPNEAPSEAARNLGNLAGNLAGGLVGSPYSNEQSVKLLNLNINNYLASLNRLNGGVPTNEQLLSAAASLINANNILGSNPNLANYQTLSSIINNSTYGGALAGKPSLPVAGILSNPASSSVAPVNGMSGMNGVPSVATNLPNSPSNSPVQQGTQGVQGLPAILNAGHLNRPIVSNGLPIANLPIPNLPIAGQSMASQPMHASNRNMVNILNNANKAFDLAGDDSANATAGQPIGEPNPNYLTFNGENSMPEHWRLLINGMQKFSLSLIKSLHNFEPRDTSAGIILSPFSIWSTLIVTYMGAKSETEREMADVLNLRNVPKETVLLAYRGLKEWYDLRCRNMNLTKSPVDETPMSPGQKMNFCSLANRVFFNSNLKLNSFVKENFGQETKSMDFVHEVEKSRQAINHWIEQKTNNKIKDLIAPGSINSFTNILIANAIYFQAKWLTQFDPTKTVKGKFQVNPTEETTVSYMRQTANFMYGVSESIKSTIIELPYSNQEFSMVLMLPVPQMGIDSLVKQLSVEHLDEILSNLYDEEVEVQIPRFKFEQEFELAGPLYSMGMKRIFDPRFSDFSGFLEPPATNRSGLHNSTADDELNDVATPDDLYNNKLNKKVIINSVVHKAFISIDEEGTEAAAATAMLIARSGRPAFPSQFIANRPFLFLVRDTTTNAISFMGIVRRPSTD